MVIWNETQRSCVVSTGNMPERLARTLDYEDPINLPWVFERTEYGYRFYTEAEQAPKEIAPLLRAAAQDGFRWVEFDCDAELQAGFDTWDW